MTNCQQNIFKPKISGPSHYKKYAHQLMLQQLFKLQNHKYLLRSMLFLGIFVLQQILSYFMLPKDRKFNSMIFYYFMPCGNIAMEDFELISTEKYYLSNSTFKTKIKFSHQNWTFSYYHDGIFG